MTVDSLVCTSLLPLVTLVAATNLTAREVARPTRAFAPEQCRESKLCSLCKCVCYVFSSNINSTELEARNPLTPLSEEPPVSQGPVGAQRREAQPAGEAEKQRSMPFSAHSE